MKKINLFCFVLFCLNIYSSQAQTPYPENAWEKVHQFDFWLGEWDVYIYGTDSLVAQSHIETIMDSMGFQENYSTLGGGYKGTSLNKYNFSKDQWEQYYIDNQGMTLRLLGNLEDGKMVLKNKKEFKNKPSYNEISWEPQEDGSVRQTWKQRWEGEEEWRLAFDGIYRRKGKSPKK